jgi:DNA-binding transcriptional MerR regulator
VIRPATNKKGNRLYTMSDIENFKKIYHLVKEKGFTLKGARVELKELKGKSKLDEPMEDTFVSEPLVDNPVEIPLSSVSEISFHDDLVDKMAIRNSLEKMKASLLEIERDLHAIAE